MNFIGNRNFRAGPQTSLEGFICPQNSDKKQKIKVFGRSEADRVGKGTSCPVPEDIKAIEFIQKVTGMLDEWVKQDKRRAFFIIAGTENASNEDARGLAVGNGGEDIELAHIACAALENNEDFRKAMFHACMLKESVNEENDNNDSK